MPVTLLLRDLKFGDEHLGLDSVTAVSPCLPASGFSAGCEAAVLFSLETSRPELGSNESDCSSSLHEECFEPPTRILGASETWKATPVDLTHHPEHAFFQICSGHVFHMV